MNLVTIKGIYLIQEIYFGIKPIGEKSYRQFSSSFYEELVQHGKDKHGAFKLAYQTMKDVEACDNGNHKNCKNARCNKGE